MYVIMPFEKKFYKEKYNYEVQYYGHPLVDIIDESLKNKEIIKNVKPIIAILPGSRKQEINSTLNKVLSIVKDFKKYQFIIAGLNHINKNIYDEAVAKSGASVKVLYNKTYDLLKNSNAAIVTSGTATLETALIGTPQIVCYATNSLNMFLAKLFVKINFISLVNLILNKEVVKELIQSDFNKEMIKSELNLILKGKRNQIQKDYKDLRNLLKGEDIESKIVNHIINN
jgi:lipid-A-disaccharide synthase